ncbi:MAG: SNF2-related protein, partial [Elusimicrobia bacterium]|nr:SNF2-related protein [Elusimicrobiota bacterium]
MITNISAPESKLDPFCVENNLRSWASSRIIARGIDYCRKGRVLSLELLDGNRVRAEVEGSIAEPYRVEIRFDANGLPAAKCSCPFDWEPLCKHAVAALIAWQQEETGSEPRISPQSESTGPLTADAPDQEKYIQDLARLERTARAASGREQNLKVLRRPAQGIFGTYLVGSSVPDRTSENYRVTVRDAAWNHASCDCPDYRVNELGTCKHVERVRVLLKKAGGLDAAQEKARRPWVYLGSRPSHRNIHRPAQEIRFYCPSGLASRAPEWLRQHVDPDGWLRDGKDPERQLHDFKRMLRRLEAAGLRPEVDPAARELLEQEARRRLWERRVEALAGDPRRSAWRRSAGRMDIRLHPYQVQGILFAAKKRRAFIGDDMGLGKTVQGIGTALLLRELGAVKRALVIVPASLKQQWKREIESACDAGVEVIAGSAKERDRQYRRLGTFFVVANYELMYRDLESILALKPDLVILDEAQRVKNWETKIARTLKRLGSPCRLVLTGTPLQNRLHELQGISEFLDPKLLGAPWKLMPTYARLDAQDKVAGYTNLDHLRRRLERFLIRRTRPEVLSQLPKRTDNAFWTPILPAQQDVHDELASQVVRLVNKWKKHKRLTREDMNRLLMLLTCMRIVCNAYGQYDWKSVEAEVLKTRRASGELKARIGSPKLEEFRKVLGELLETPGQKLVIFSQWERMLRLAELYVRNILEERGARHVMFTGALSLRKRDAEVRRFHEDPDCRIFFSTDAGGVGLNLQRAASVVVNLEMPWNPAVLEQRVGRVLRLGQKKSVEVVNFISSECIEEKIFNLVAQKK